MPASVETITPDKAKEILSKNPDNRRVRPHDVAKIARAIVDRRWRLNGETLKIGRDGILLDGQHRLLAVVKSGIAIETYVVRDVDPDTFDTIDIGAKRSVADTLRRAGCMNANVVGGGIRVVEQLKGGQIFESNVKVTPDEARLFLLDQPAIEYSASITGNCRQIISPSVACGLHFLFGKKDAGLADAFFGLLAEGTGMSAGHPVWVLREKLRTWSLGKHRPPQVEILAASIRAWNAFRTGRSLKSLQGTIAKSDGTLEIPEIL